MTTQVHCPSCDFHIDGNYITQDNDGCEEGVCMHCGCEFEVHRGVPGLINANQVSKHATSENDHLWK